MAAGGGRVSGGRGAAPDAVLAPFNLGLVLIALGRPEEARHALLRAAALNPDDAEIQDALQSLSAEPADPAPAEPADADQEAEQAAPFSGDIKTFALPEVLEFLRLQSKTGSLVVSSRRGAAIVRLVRGRITGASAPGVKRLGESLVEKGLVSRPDLEIVLKAQRARPDSSVSLGDLLLRQRPSDRSRSRERCSNRWSKRWWRCSAGRKVRSLCIPAASGVPTISFDVQNVMLELMGRDG